MNEQELKSKIHQTITQLISSEHKNFVIYPFGKIGKLTKEILNEKFGIKERYVVDNTLCLTDLNIKSIEYLENDYFKNDFDILFATKYTPPKTHDIYKHLESFVSSNRLFDVLQSQSFVCISKPDKIRETLAYQISELGKKKFVIYPYNKNGKLIKEILNNDFGIQEKYVCDDIQNSNTANIKSIVYMKSDYFKDDFFILLSEDINTLNKIETHNKINQFASTERIVTVFSSSTFFNPNQHYTDISISQDIRYKTIEAISREIYKNNIQGSVAEAGVFRGAAAQRINHLFPDRKLYLFDTFEGFDERDQKNDDVNNRFNEKLDFSNTSEDLVLSKMIYPQNCIIKKGWFPESAQGITDKFSFVRLDMDLYDPIYAGLKFFYPLMSKGGYITVHDCRSKHFDGAREALIDFCKENHLNYMCMPDELGTAVIPIGF